MDIKRELSNLAALQERGLLTVGEFNEAKAQLLSRAQSERGTDAGLAYGSATVDHDPTQQVTAGRLRAAPQSQGLTQVPARRKEGRVLAAVTLVALGLGGVAAYQVISAQAQARAVEAERSRVAQFNYKPSGLGAGLKPPDDRSVELNFVTAWAARSLEQRAMMCAGYEADSDRMWESFNHGQHGLAPGL